MTLDLLSVRPHPPAHHADRWREAGLRRRMLYGRWREDLDAYIRDHIGALRQGAWGHGDISSCAWLDIASAMATLYDREPELHADRVTTARRVREALGAAGWQSIGQRIQRDTIALREMHLHPSLSSDGTLTLIPAWSSDVVGEPHPQDPERLGYARWLRPRRTADGRPIWTWEHWDVRGVPTYRVEDDQGHDLTRQMVEGEVEAYDGDAYPWRYADGTPYVPLVTYHAARTGMLYDWETGGQITEGTLRIGLYYTMVGHIFRNSAWSQRYSIGVDWIGGSTSTTRDGHREIVADPAVVLEGRIAEDGTSAQVGAWTTPIGPAEMLGAVQSYARTLYAVAGLNPADIARVDGDPRSGYALAVTRDGQRELQRRFEAVFARSDQELARMVGAMLGEPDVEYRVTYPSLPPSPDELRAMQEYVDAEIAAGRMSQIQAYQYMHPGLSERDALEELRAIQALRRAMEVDDVRDEPERDDESDDEPEPDGAPATE